jgi:hypothetical protein
MLDKVQITTCFNISLLSSEHFRTVIIVSAQLCVHGFRVLIGQDLDHPDPFRDSELVRPSFMVSFRPGAIIIGILHVSFLST